MKETRLPEIVTKTYFDCIEQQIMTLCMYFHKEFWKLFIDQQLRYIDGEVNKVENAFRYENFLIKNAERYYGISIIDVSDRTSLSFENGEIYLAYIDLKYYPLTRELEREGTHAMLIYGEEEDKFLVNDNYCGVTEYLLGKEIYQKGIKKIGKVQYDGKKNADCFKEFIGTFLVQNCKSYEKGYKYIIQNQIKSYESVTFIDLISKISCMIKKDALMVFHWNKNEKFLTKCVQIMDFLANRVRKKYYAILKAQIKYGEVPEQLLFKTIKEVLINLRCEEKVKQEVLNISQKKKSLKEVLHEQVLEYVEETEFDDSTSVYDLHDEWSIIYLINYFEKCNGLMELEYDDFAECESYEDFELVIYEKLILKDIYDRNSGI